MTVTTQLRLPDDVATWARQSAKAKGISLNQAIIDAIEYAQMSEAARAYDEVARHRDEADEMAAWQRHRDLIAEERAKK
ncbi:hypothetical protein [Stackebrandtia soli]|uniref:hypothetical protein n=1 Tax=Stackebrandtia soli TaxID=1892856 RepID=UPI0039EA76D5